MPPGTRSLRILNATEPWHKVLTQQQPISQVQQRQGHPPAPRLNHTRSGANPGEQLLTLKLPGKNGGGENEALDLSPTLGWPTTEKPERALWVRQLRQTLEARSPEAVSIADEAMRAYPGDSELLLLAALTGLAAGKPESNLLFLKRYQKRYGAAKLLACAPPWHWGNRDRPRGHG